MFLPRLFHHEGTKDTKGTKKRKIREGRDEEKQGRISLQARAMSKMLGFGARGRSW